MKRLAAVFALACLGASSAFALSPDPLAAKGKAKASAKIEIRLPEGGAGPGGNFGLGVLLGEPTGISAKYWFDDSSAADAALAYSFFVRQSLAFHADYLFHARNAVVFGEEEIPPFAGIGGYLRLYGDDPNPIDLGLRVPLGLCYRFRRMPLELSLEIAPCLALFPETRLVLQGGFAVRYYF